MVATPVIDRVKPKSNAIASDIAEQNAIQIRSTMLTLDEYRTITETLEVRLEYRNR